MRIRSIALTVALLLTFIILVPAARAADAKALFLQIPSGIIKNVDRAASIKKTGSGLLHLQFPNDFTGEFKVLSDKKDEIIVGLTVYSCEESDIEIWSLKKSAWMNITDSALPKLGEKDVIGMLTVSPATVESLQEKATISYFFTFISGSSDLQLIVRRQKSCDIAGSVYAYKFNGKKFIKERKK